MSNTTVPVPAMNNNSVHFRHTVTIDSLKSMLEKLIRHTNLRLRLDKYKDRCDTIIKQIHAFLVETSATIAPKKWSGVFEEFWRLKLESYGHLYDYLYLEPWWAELDNFLIETGQRAFLDEGGAWDVSAMLQHAEEEMFKNYFWGRRGDRKWEQVKPLLPEPYCFLRACEVTYSLACLREVSFVRCYTFLREYQDICTRDNFRRGLNGKLPVELIDMVAEQACDGRQIPLGLPGQAVELPWGLSFDEKQLKAAEVAIQFWKQLQE